MSGDGYFPEGSSILRRVHSERAVGLFYGQRALMIGALKPLAFVGTTEHTNAKLKPFQRLSHTADAGLPRARQGGARPDHAGQPAGPGARALRHSLQPQPAAGLPRGGPGLRGARPLTPRAVREGYNTGHFRMVARTERRRLRRGERTPQVA
jgi:hypothetical protein